MPEKDVFRAYLSDEYPSDFTYQEIRPYVFSIPTQQAYEDLKTFQYILDTAYSGREYWEKQNNSFSEAYARVSRWIARNGESVLISEFLTTLHDSFSFIHDGHLAITSAEGGSVSFAHTYKAFFADLLLEEAVDTCAVVTSAVPELPEGSC